MKSKLLILLTAAAVAGCTASISNERKEQPLVDAKMKVAGASVRPSTYLRVYGAENTVRVPPVSVPSDSALSIRQVLSMALPGFQVTPTDASVDLSRRIGLFTHEMALSDFLKLLNSLSGYEFSLRGQGLIDVAGLATREWTLVAPTAKIASSAALAGSGSSSGGGGSSGGGSGGGGSSGGGSGGGGSSGGGGGRNISVSFTGENDEWDEIVSQVNAIVTGGPAGSSFSGSELVATDSAGAPIGASPSTGGSSSSSVAAIRSLGIIRATGSIAKIRKADEYIESVRFRSEQMVRLDVKMIEVTLNDSKARGIDWSGVLGRVFASGNNFALGLGISLPAEVDATSGLTNLTGSLTRGDGVYDAAVQLLGQYGRVELTNQPQVSTLNGRPALLSAGREFGYVAGSTSNVSNGTVSTSIETQRLLVGVELSIKPIVTQDGRIYMEIVPIVSSLEGLDTFSTPGAQVTQPRIVLSQLATTGIVRSGETLPVGGLITSRLREAKKNLPIDGDPNLGPAQILLEAVANALERKEMVALVTPTLVSR